MALGFFAYLIGLIISVVLGFFNFDPVISLILLAALGLIVGFLNLGKDAEHLFSLFSLTFFFWVAHYLFSNVLSVFGTSTSSALAAIFLNALLFSLATLLVLSFKNLFSSSFPSASSASNTRARSTAKVTRVA